MLNVKNFLIYCYRSIFVYNHIRNEVNCHWFYSPFDTDSHSIYNLLDFVGAVVSNYCNYYVDNTVTSL